MVFIADVFDGQDGDGFAVQNHLFLRYAETLADAGYIQQLCQLGFGIETVAFQQRESGTVGNNDSTRVVPGKHAAGHLLEQ